MLIKPPIPCHFSPRKRPMIYNPPSDAKTKSPIDHLPLLAKAKTNGKIKRNGIAYVNAIVLMTIRKIFGFHF